MYTVTYLPNGLITIFDRASKLRGTYNRDFTYRHGDLKLSTYTVEKIISQCFSK